MTSRLLAVAAVLLLLTLAVGAYLLPGGGAKAQEEIDISGEWTITLDGDLDTWCLASFVQAGASVAAIVDCRGFLPWTVSGSIDTATGAFDIVGDYDSWSAGLAGTIAANGDDVGGTWSVGAALAGAFTGRRGVEPPTNPPPNPDVVNLIGEWNFTMTFLPGSDGPVPPVACTSGIQQVGAEILLAISCPEDREGVLLGLVDANTNRLTLIGRLEQPIVVTTFASPDGTSFEGTLFVLSIIPIDVVANRKNSSPDFIDLTGDWDLELDLLETEPDQPGFPESCAATFRQRLSILVVNLDCASLGGKTYEGRIYPISRDFTFSSTDEELRGGFVGTATSGGNFMLGVWSDNVRGLNGGFRATRTSGPFGDVNCDAVVNSIDAAILLQFNAGLILSLACPEFADMNASQDISSIDAALILQRIAGLI